MGYTTPNIDRIAREGVDDAVLQRVKTQWAAGEIYKLDSMFAQAMEIGQLESVGISYRLKKRMIEKLQAVSAEQVQAVAQEYFRDERLTVAELDPQPLSQTPRVHSVAPRH